MRIQNNKLTHKCLLLLQEFRGTYQHSTPVQIVFPTPVEARYLHIIPLKWKTQPSLLIQVLGCKKQPTTKKPKAKKSERYTITIHLSIKIVSPYV